MTSSRPKSLVFLDLEATDLPQYRPAITEIALLACSSDHFENCVGAGTEQLPRVLHKLTLCVNPVRRIAPEAVVITGLDNFLLQDENILSAKTAKLLSTFLDNLNQPVCLVAHNGNAFDFPLLARSLRECNSMISVSCVDSLPIFRKIDKDNKKFEEFLDSELAELENEEQESLRQINLDANIGDASTSIRERSPSPDMFADIIEDDILSQLTEQAEFKYNCDVSTPVNKIRSATSPPKLKPKAPATKRLNRAQVIPRKLFKPSYKLTEIFGRFFGVPPGAAHRAEEDTLILLKCARFQAKDFLLNIPDRVRDLQSFVK